RHRQAKKQKTSEEVPDKEKTSEEIPEEKVKEMVQLVPIEEVYVQALQVKHPIIDWKKILILEFSTDILKERKEMASIKEAHYKQKLKGYYNKNVKPSTFKPGTYML
nr:reverse transcriptase domain-containing protein [Tanacetum cinerariifolium]